MPELLFGPQHFRALEQTANRAEHEVDSHYCSGYPAFEGGETPLSFHSGWHTRAVRKDSLVVATALSLPPPECAVTEAAAATHDVVQFLGRGINEAKSAAWLTEQLHSARIFPEAAVQMGSLAILGTQPIFNANGILVNQVASTQDYPSKQAELIAKSVASGDLGELFAPQGPLMAHLLWLELQGLPPNANPSLEHLLPFQAKQIELLTTYTYPLKEAETLLTTYKSQVIRYSEKLLKQLQKGEFQTFRELTAQDEQFMREIS